MKSKKFNKGLPKKVGLYEMKDGNEVYTIIVEKLGDIFSFREKGQPWLYDLNTTKHCLFRKI